MRLWCIVLLLFIISCKDQPVVDPVNQKRTFLRNTFGDHISVQNKDSADYYLVKYRHHAHENNYDLTNQARYYNNMARYHHEFDNLDSSIHYAQLCIDHIPDSLASSFDFGVKIIAKANLALTYSSKNELEKSIKTLEEAIQMSFKYNYPSYRLFAYSNLCSIYDDQKKYTKVKELGKEAKGSILKYWGNYPEEMANIDRIISMAIAKDPKSTLEEKKEALSLLLALYKKKPFDSILNDILAVDIVHYFGDLLSLKQKKELITSVWNTELQKINSVQKRYTRITYASTLNEEGKTKEAIEVLSPLLEAPEKWIEHSSMLTNAAYLIYKNDGQHEKALAYLEQNKKIKEATNDQLFNSNFLEAQSKYNANRLETHSIILQERNDLIFKTLSVAAVLLLLSLLFLITAIILFKRVRKKHKQLEVIDKNKNELFLILAHDLKGPMSSFDKMSKRVSYLIEKKDFENLDKLANYFENIGSSLKYSVYNLLDWSLSQREKIALEKEEFDIRVHINQSIADLKYFTKEKNIIIEIHPKSNIEARVFMDINSFVISFRNILHNAIKNANEGTTVLIDIQSKENTYVFEVINTGKHIDPTTLKTLNQLIQSKGSDFASMKMRDSGIGLNTTIKLLKFNNCRIQIRNINLNQVSFLVSIDKPTS